MKKSILVLSITAVFASVDASAFTLPAGAVLSIETGSKFNMGGSSSYPSDCSGGGIAITSGTNQSKGLYVGANLDDFSSGPHGGPPSPSDRGGVTAQWTYFCNTGVNYLSETVGSGTFSGDTDPGVGVDMSSWIVGWNGIATIPMGTNVIGISQLYCGVDCSDGDTYSIVHAATVPAGDPSGFGGVRYDVCLMGTITAAGSLPANTVAPTATNDDYLTSENTQAVRGPITRNDIDPEINDAPDKNTIDLDTSTPGVIDQTNVPTPQGGLISVNPATGIITYDPATNFTGVDTINYTIKDYRTGLISNVASITFTVGNSAPVCNNDSGIVLVSDGETFVDIDVTANDSDVNVAYGDTIDKNTVTIVTPPSNGAITLPVPSTGIVTYTPNPGFEGIDTFAYTVDDTDGPVSCAPAGSVQINVTNAGQPIAGVADAYLVIDTGDVGTDNKVLPALGKGSWFSMELVPGIYTYTPLAGLNHIHLGEVQPALSPNTPNIDNPWIFFGNVGLSQTTSPVIQLSNDIATGVATLDFRGWDVTWNAIPSINLGSGPDNGIATMTCYTDLLAGTQGDCSVDGTEFILTYRAIVPDGDVSGFGGVNYAIHFEGHVSALPPKAGCLNATAPANVIDVSVIDDCTSSSVLTFSPGLVATAVGNTTGLNLTAANIGINDPKFNPKGGEMCVGGCLDFIINGIATNHADIVVKLNAPIPDGGVYRKLINGRWFDFDISGDDVIGSQALDATTGNCQGPEGVFDIGLRPGAQCLYLRIYDGGPNDADGMENGTIVDPSGVLFSGPPNVPPSSTNGCSISSTPVHLVEHADWLLVVGFLAVMGLVSVKRRHLNG